MAQADPTPTSTPAPPPNVLTVPLRDDGTIGELPPQLKDYVTKEVSRVAGRIRDDHKSPLTEEKLRAAEAEIEKFRLKDAEALSDYEKAKTLANERHEREIAAEREKHAKALDRVKRLQASTLEAAALRAGADPERVKDFTKVIADRLSIGDDLEDVVLGEDGKPTDLDIAAFAKAELDKRAWFKPAPAAGGGARGGASLHTGTTAGGSTVQQQYDEALAAWAKTPNTANMMRVRELKAQIGAT